MTIVAVDIGGTHVRFALAELDGSRVRLGAETVLKTGDYPDLPGAWRDFADIVGHPLPAAAALAVAAPVSDEEIKLTNNRWVLRQAGLANELGVARLTLINDFAAVAYGVSACKDDDLQHLCGPDVQLPAKGVTSIVGPGTGLGVAILTRDETGPRVIATEGGHVGFAPVDELEDRILSRLRARHGRVSVERIVSGAGLAIIHAVMTGAEQEQDDRLLWQHALAGTDADAEAARDRFCGLLGSVAGDFALAHGADAVVIAGGLGLRLAGCFARSGFADRFRAKGRSEKLLAGIPVKVITHPQPGLLGAAAAFAAEHGS